MINSITIREENEEDEIHGIFREEEEHTIHSSSTEEEQIHYVSIEEEQIHHYYIEEEEIRDSIGIHEEEGVEEIIYTIGILQVYLIDALTKVITCEENESVNEVMCSIC